MAIATNIINDSIQKTKNIFFPINKNFWLKIGLVSLLSHKGSSNFNYRLTNPLDLKSLVNFIKSHIYVILAVSTGLFFLGILFPIISYTFNFIFLESLFSKKILIKEYFKKFLKNGMSLFWFNFILSMIELILVVSLSIPILMPLIKNWGNLSWSQFSVPYLVFFAIFFILDLIIVGLISFVINNFVIMDMYTRNTKSLDSFKKMLKLIKLELSESLVYLLMRVVLSIATAIISILIFVALLLIFLIIGAVIAIILYLLYLVLNTKLVLIILGIIILIILVLIFIYAVAVVLSPIHGFYYLYAYNFFNQLKKRNKIFFKNAKQ